MSFIPLRSLLSDPGSIAFGTFRPSNQISAFSSFQPTNHFLHFHFSTYKSDFLQLAFFNLQIKFLAFIIDRPFKPDFCVFSISGLQIKFLAFIIFLLSDQISCIQQLSFIYFSCIKTFPFFQFCRNAALAHNYIDATASIGPSLCSVTDGHHFLSN